jgi:hypothetical protein
MGWRHTYAALGVLVLATMVPVGLLLFRGRPELFGLKPDLGGQVSPSRSPPEPVYSRAEALSTAVFWTLSAANILSNALGTGLLLSHYDLLAQVGLSRDAAVVLFTPLAITQVVATMLTGPAVDRVPPHRLVALPMASMAGACLLMATMGSPGERSPMPWCWGSRWEAFRRSTAQSTLTTSDASMRERYAG